jgi:Mg2+ and Co2+ transporter CorA
MHKFSAFILLFKKSTFCLIRQGMASCWASFPVEADGLMDAELVAHLNREVKAFVRATEKAEVNISELHRCARRGIECVSSHSLWLYCLILCILYCSRQKAHDEAYFNRCLYLLTVVTTLLTPMQLLSGVYGMNFDFMPELHWHYGYPVFWAVNLMIIASLAWYFRSRHVLQPDEI